MWWSLVGWIYGDASSVVSPEWYSLRGLDSNSGVSMVVSGVCRTRWAFHGRDKRRVTLILAGEYLMFWGFNDRAYQGNMSAVFSDECFNDLSLDGGGDRIPEIISKWGEYWSLHDGVEQNAIANECCICLSLDGWAHRDCVPVVIGECCCSLDNGTDWEGISVFWGKFCNFFSFDGGADQFAVITGGWCTGWSWNSEVVEDTVSMANIEVLRCAESLNGWVRWVFISVGIDRCCWIGGVDGGVASDVIVQRYWCWSLNGWFFRPSIFVIVGDCCSKWPIFVGRVKWGSISLVVWSDGCRFDGCVEGSAISSFRFGVTTHSLSVLFLSSGSRF